MLILFKPFDCYGQTFVERCRRIILQVVCCLGDVAAARQCMVPASAFRELDRAFRAGVFYDFFREVENFRFSAGCKIVHLADSCFRFNAPDDAICRIEEEVDFCTDQELEEMKRRRAWLKDRIYTSLRHACLLPPGVQQQFAVAI